MLAHKQLQEISARIKDLREFSDYTVESFAEKLGLTAGEYAEYENAERDIPIGILYNIAGVLDIDPSVILFGKGATKHDATVVYAGKGESIERYEGYSFISLTPDFINPELEPMLVTIKEGVTPELVRHSGQELNYVLKGKLLLMLGDREFYLRAGDSIYFNASLPHAQVPMDGDAEFLTVIQK